MFSIEGTTIRITKGDTGLITLVLDNYKLNDDDQAVFTVKSNIDDVDFVIQTVEESFDDGKAHFSIYESDTYNLPAGKYVYDIQLNLADGRVETVIPPSVFKVEKGVTD